MTSGKKETQRPTRGRSVKAAGGTGAQGAPQWAEGLRRLYDSVLDEPLPDSFKDLLAKLDDPR